MPAINWKLLGDKYDWVLGYNNEAGNMREIRFFLHFLSIWDLYILQIQVIIPTPLSVIY